MSESSIKSLLDMGITRDVAIEALAKTNGDVEASVNYIFSGELPQQSFHTDTVEISPQYPKETESYPQVRETVEFVEDAQAEPDISASDSESANWLGTAVTVDEPQIKNCVDDPLVVQMGTPNALMENYFAIFCLVVGYGFPCIFLKPDFKDLVCGNDWYKGHFSRPKYRIRHGPDDTTDIIAQEELTGQDNLALQPELLWQFQRMLAVQISSNCQRKFVEARFFAKVLEPQVIDKLNNCEHLHDVLPTFIKSLATDLELCPQISSARELFISSAYYKPPSEPEPIETLVSLLHFMPEEYESNLYKMFNALLYPDSDPDEESEEIHNSLGNLAPLITIVFDEMDEGTENVNISNGVEVPLKFYPQLYTEKAKKLLINDVLSRSRAAEIEARKVLRDLNDLKSFQGKHIHSFLNSSLDFISRDSSSSDDPNIANLLGSLQNVKEDLSVLKTNKMAEYKALTNKIHNEWNLSHPELGLIESATAIGIIDEPYLLTSAVMSPADYFLRQPEGQWHHVQYKPNLNDTNVTKVFPQDVIHAIRSQTRSASESPLMFTYFKESVIEDVATVQSAAAHNTGVRNFAIHDQDILNPLMNPNASKEDLIDF
ncbi:LADA_0B04280g1_1 [Lachancea dasiensis]|uniref:LADA_0B04280g1_1 n=1 Tax=Lachancea dasiensis TaxID=1072105 RepID=A0A1G4IT68_9SACH|nr:LADA_0B04280g1_1 [Lachancea dasiensis]